MMPIKQLGIALIGDEDLVNGMRLAGVSQYHVIRGERDAAEEVREVLTRLMAEPELGIIMIMEEYARHADDMLAQAKASKRLTPVIIEVPSKQGTIYGDTKEYYKAFIRKFIGFDVEI